MQKLLEGIVKFKQEDFEAHKELFGSLGKTQNPHTLFISCTDSRVNPNLITKTLPGELFIIRNVANLVPPFDNSEQYRGTTSSIEYAVLALNVENIIVCGHSNCGGCSAALNKSDILTEMPNVSKWLDLVEPVAERVKREIPEDQPEARAWLVEQRSVVAQLKNLLSYPYIKERVKSGKLHISGWYYIIETGEVYIYDRFKGQFILGNG